jgi:hypothetical protein
VNEYFEMGYVKVHVMPGHSAKFACGRRPGLHPFWGNFRVGGDTPKAHLYVEEFLVIPDVQMISSQQKTVARWKSKQVAGVG